jgi:5-amino-6-(5-phosphoribosylamino)uracil reductase
VPGQEQAREEVLVAERPYTVLSCAVSMDGYLGGPTEHRLVLSNAADLDRVDGVRAASDAVLVGATTVRRDNPRLLVRDPGRRERRVARGTGPDPVKVTVTSSGDLDPAADFFTAGDAPRLVYCTGGAAPGARARLGDAAEVVDAGGPLALRWVSEDLHRRGVRRLLVEGGGAVLTQFLCEDLADELHLAVAPLFVGDARAPRFVRDGRFPWDAARRAPVAGVRTVGDVVLIRYALSERCRPDDDLEEPS